MCPVLGACLWLFAWLTWSTWPEFLPGIARPEYRDQPHDAEPPAQPKTPMRLTGRWWFGQWYR